MNVKRVYDIPTRLFHWGFALCFILAFTIANTFDDESPIFSYHMIAGLLMCFIVSWRVLWGIVGSKHARFSDFVLNPVALVQYGKDLFHTQARTWHGHNPASSWAALTMMALGLGSGISGTLMATNNGNEALKDIHELCANGFLILVLMHIVGIVIHTLKHKDAIGKSMISGHKHLADGDHKAVPSHPVAGLSLLLLTAGFAGYLFINFDPATKNLALFGNQLHLGEFEDEENEHHHGKQRHKTHHHEDD